MSRLATRRPDNHHHAALEEADCLKSWLAIVEPNVLLRVGSPGKDHCGIGEVEVTLSSASHRV
jgi:hypothetical protein